MSDIISNGTRVTYQSCRSGSNPRAGVVKDSEVMTKGRWYTVDLEAGGTVRARRAELTPIPAAKAA